MMGTAMAEDCGGCELTIVSLSLLKLSLGILKLLAFVSFFRVPLGSVSHGLFGSKISEVSTGTDSVLLIGTSLASGSGAAFALSRPQPPIFFLGPLHITILSFLSGVSVTVVSSELTLFVDLLTLSIQLPLLLCSLISGTLGGDSVKTELFLVSDGD